MFGEIEILGFINLILSKKRIDAIKLESVQLQ